MWFLYINMRASNSGLLDFVMGWTVSPKIHMLEAVYLFSKRKKIIIYISHYTFMILPFFLEE